MNSLTQLTPQQLRRAADIQERILGLQHELNQVLGTHAQYQEAPTGRRKMSAQGLANIRAGARKRWARFQASTGNGMTEKKPRRKMSAAGRASIAARMRARWAAAKRAGRNAL